MWMQGLLAGVDYDLRMDALQQAMDGPSGGAIGSPLIPLIIVGLIVVAMYYHNKSKEQEAAKQQAEKESRRLREQAELHLSWERAKELKKEAQRRKAEDGPAK